MLQLDQNNLLITKTLTERVNAVEEKSLDRIVTDFDFTTYHLLTFPDQKSQILISVYLKCWDDLVKYGVVDYLKGKYSPYSDVLTILDPKDAETNYNYSIVLDLEKARQSDATSVINEISYLKRHCLAAPFERGFARYDELAEKYASSNTYSEEIQGELLTEEVIVIKYRGAEECIFIKPSFDRVTVIFSTTFQDEMDKTFGKVFLQEFVDARKRSVQTAPQVLFTQNEPPLDIRKAAPTTKFDTNKGYVTFVLFPRHLVKGDRRDNCISHIQYFRNYFHYHIKCSKAYMHSRMRHRVKEFLKVLNRAKPENVDNDGRAIENRKTASGRRFDARA